MEKIHFKNFDPSTEIRERAEKMCESVEDEAPDDARVSAVLDWDGERYHCSLEVGSKVWPASVSVVHLAAARAMEKAEISLKARLTKWRALRPRHFEEMAGFSFER